jgi:hydroxypyruvate isomerase
VIAGFSAHLNTVYAQLHESDRLPAVVADGFSFVEMWEMPPPHLADQVLSQLASSRLQLTSVNTSPGTQPASFGLMSDPASKADWRADFTRTLTFARTADAGTINLLTGGRLPALSRAQQRRCLLDNLTWALDQREAGDPQLLLEPLNGADRPSPMVNRVGDAIELIERLGRPDGVAVLFDAYHVAQEEDDLLHCLTDAISYVGHVQIADFPGRGQPGTGTLPITPFLDLLNDLGYSGCVGLEYFIHDGAAPLDWTKGTAIQEAAIPVQQTEVTVI